MIFSDLDLMGKKVPDPSTPVVLLRRPSSSKETEKSNVKVPGNLRKNGV